MSGIVIKSMELSGVLERREPKKCGQIERGELTPQREYRSDSNIQ